PPDRSQFHMPGARCQGIPTTFATRPFDPHHYREHNHDLKGDHEALADHYLRHGCDEGRHANFYAYLKSQAPHVDKALAQLVIEPDLQRRILEGQEDAAELACEIIRLGAPWDSRISDFSADAYLDWYPDIGRARMDPLYHYLRFGWAEGWRRTLGDLRKGLHQGGQVFRPELPTVLICVHEMSRTGAPIVGRDLVREASETHNVIVASLREGELLDQFLPHCCQALITPMPLREMPYLMGETVQHIDFAILNSVECAPFVHLLVAREIPFTAYLHEYADYTFPAWKMAIMAAFSDLLVFSSDHVRDSWNGRLADIQFDTGRDSIILPQRPLHIGNVTGQRLRDARARLGRAIGRDLSQARVVCGAGHLQWRKGSDIFLTASQICRDRDPDCVFVWIGDGRSAEEPSFGLWFEYQLNQSGANQPGSNMFVLPAGPLYMDVLAASDTMFVSSRLDPLPNVVFDALAQGCSVVCFDGGTGFIDDIYRSSDRIRAVEYANPVAAVDALLGMPRKLGTDEQVSRPAPVALFARIAESLRNRLSAQRNFVLGESAIDVSILFGPSEEERPFRRREREKLQTYGRRMLWRDVEEAAEALAASPNWTHRRCRLEPYSEAPASTVTTPDFAIHIHAFYTDELEDDLRDRAAYSRAKRIVVTTDTQKKADEIQRLMANHGLSAELVLAPNRGRDILPFLELFGSGGIAGDDEIWCHVHQKKSLTSASGGDIWRRFLLRILLGDSEHLSAAMTRIADGETGLVAPFDPHFVSWAGSRRLLPQIEDRLSGPLPADPLVFPVGNMFWTKASVARRMLNLFGEDYLWPNEPIANDGTEFHLIERLWPAVATECGLDSVFLHKLDERRV
ncbi:rhamnan synthesis F family protein, partial [Paracoccus benzoatiresistens]